MQLTSTILRADVEVEVDEPSVCRVDAGVVDEQVDGAEPSPPPRRSTSSWCAGVVGAAGDGHGDVGAAERLDGRVEGVLLARGDADPGALGDEALGDAEADAPAGPGDDGGAALEPAGVRGSHARHPTSPSTSPPCAPEREPCARAQAHEAGVEPRRRRTTVSARSRPRSVSTTRRSRTAADPVDQPVGDEPGDGAPPDLVEVVDGQPVAHAHREQHLLVAHLLRRQRLAPRGGRDALGQPAGIRPGVLDVPPAHAADVAVRAGTDAPPVAAGPVAVVVAAPPGRGARPVAHLVPVEPGRGRAPRRRSRTSSPRRRRRAARPRRGGPARRAWCPPRRRAHRPRRAPAPARSPASRLRRQSSSDSPGVP